MKINWKKLQNKIPSRVWATTKAQAEVVWVDEFKNPDIVGEMRPDSKQIVIKTGQSPKETVHTFFHECLHLWSDFNDVGLTETQVQKLEKLLPILLKQFLNTEKE